MGDRMDYGHSLRRSDTANLWRWGGFYHNLLKKIAFNALKFIYVCGHSGDNDQYFLAALPVAT